MADNRYYDYIRLKDLLSCQVPLSEAHHEFFFIIIHQVYELWFRAILFELNSVLKTFGRGEVSVLRDGEMKPQGIDEKEIVEVVSRLNRIVEILRLLIAQIRVMETLTPLDFLDFRDRLAPASGYDSLQFRLIEVKLGLRLTAGRSDEFKAHKFPNKEQREKYVGNKLAEEQLAELEAANADGSRSLFDYLESWLERTPFVRRDDLGSWFEPSFKEIPEPREDSTDSDAIKEIRKVFDKTEYEKFLSKFREGRGMSHDAFLAALFIHLYRDKPILQQPHRLLEAVKEVDELFTVWRNWHSSMVMRMIGQKLGTAAYKEDSDSEQPVDKKASDSEQAVAAALVYGYKYLEGTRSYRFFPELARVSSYMIPRKYLPKIPEQVELEMERLLFSDRT